jgi:hypothetical protein
MTDCQAQSCIADGTLCDHYYVCPTEPKCAVITVRPKRPSVVERCNAQTGNWYMPPVWFAFSSLAAGYFAGHIGSAWQRGVWG